MMMALLRKMNFRNFTTFSRLFSQSTQSDIAWTNAKPFKNIPGPKNVFAFMPGGKYYKKPLIELFRALRKDYGDLLIVPSFGQGSLLSVYQPEDIENVFRNDGKYPYRRSPGSMVYFRKKYRPDLFKAGGLAVEQGHAWYDFRTKVNPILMQPRNVRMYVPQIDEVAQDFVKKVQRIRDKNEEVPSNFWSVLNEYALESLGLIALNTRLNLLDGSNEEAKELYHRLEQLFHNLFKYDFQPSIWKYYKTPGFIRAMKNSEEIAKFTRKHIDKAIEKLEKNKQQSSNHEGVLEKLLRVDKDVAKVMISDLLGGGIDTTAASIVGVLYGIASNLDKQEILREEIFKILPEKSSQLSTKSLENAPYIKATIKEGNRLYPVTIGNIRRVQQNLVLSGYQVPMGIDALLNTSSNYDFFEQPEKFIPERWLKNNHDPQCPHARDTHPFASLPFGFGPRICIGKRFAEMEIEVLIARLLREFKIEWNHPPLKFKSVTLNFPDSPLKFKFTEI